MVLVVDSERFTAIASGIKKEEHLPITEYWIKRLVISAEKNKIIYRSFRDVHLTNGYQLNHRKLDVEFKGISIEEGGTVEADKPGLQYFKINLGNIINTYENYG